MHIYLYIYTNQTKVFEHFILSHTNSTKFGLFMKGNIRSNSKIY